MARFGGPNVGWLVESFFPTTEDLRAVLGALAPKIIITNTRVPSDYEATPLQDWLANYQRFVRRATSGRPMTWRVSSHLHVSLTDPALRIDEDPVAGLPYKILEPRGPIIDFAPQLLFYDAGRLSLKIYNLDDTAAFGLEISLPRCLPRHKNYSLYQALCQGLHERSRPCVFVAGKKRLRPRLFLSTGFGDEINAHAYLQKCRLRIEPP